MIQPQFWYGKRVLVTGHTGFKGSWLAIWLEKMGAQVVGFGLDPISPKDNFVLSNLSQRMTDLRGDIRDGKMVQSILKEYQPEIVFHLAAQALVRYSYGEPEETYETNVMGTLHVLEAIRRSESVKVGIMITTDKCYKNKETKIPYKETDAFGGYDPYSASKACAEILIGSYRNSYFNSQNYEEHGKSIASVRAGNVIGGGDWAKDRIVPDCIRALEGDGIISIRNPHAVRPFQHVLDPLGGYLLLAQKMYQDPFSFAEGWNFGPNESGCVDVWTLGTALIQHYGAGILRNDSKGDVLHEANLLYLDTTKAQLTLGWKPKFSFEETIQLTASWYQEYQKKDVYQLCCEQIEAYIG